MIIIEREYLIQTSRAFNLKPKDYFIVSIHREENVDLPNNFNELLKSLNYIAEKYSKELLF